MKHFILILALSMLTVSLSQGQSLSAKDTVFVELSKVVPDIKTDVRYATTNNFTGIVLYPSSKVYIRSILADSLRSVQSKLRRLALSLKVYDAYRPLSVQKQMWAILPDPNYVADPSKGSKHNRGSAVDVTIIDQYGKELDMGTPFDDFTEKASPNYTDFPPQIIKNRTMLKQVMEESGFKQLDTEWWHFDFYCWDKFAISDFEIK